MQRVLREATRGSGIKTTDRAAGLPRSLPSPRSPLAMTSPGVDRAENQISEGAYYRGCSCAPPALRNPPPMLLRWVRVVV